MTEICKNIGESQKLIMCKKKKSQIQKNEYFKISFILSSRTVTINLAVALLQKHAGTF